MNYQARRDDQLIAEIYEQLLVETPVTDANIDRFLKKYLSREIAIHVDEARELHRLTAAAAQGRGQSIPPFDEQHEFEKARLRFFGSAINYLNRWTPNVQQRIKSSGGNPDLFGYPNLASMREALQHAEMSAADREKAIKESSANNVPLVYQTEEFNVYTPKTWTASKKYFGKERISLLDGKHKEGARWCTAAFEDPKHFKEYVVDNKDRLLYFIRKSDDTLFAYRGAGPQEKLDEKVRSFVWNIQDRYIYDYVKMYHMLPDGHANKDWFYSYVWHEIFAVVNQARNGILKEIRDQQNKEISGELHELYRQLNSLESNFNIAEHAESYLKFIAFVLYGRTELPEYKQRDSDEKLKRDSGMNPDELSRAYSDDDNDSDYYPTL